jgi:lipoate-protein ligase A
VSVVKVLPELRANGAAQMALDRGLLETTDEVVARRYTWAPPALSLGRFQKVAAEPPALPFDVVRRPSGGRAVLHGEDFEWSFAVAFPPGALGEGARAGAEVGRPYDAVANAFVAALQALGVQLDEARVEPYQRSTLCFATSLRHDLAARGEKLVAVAQARAGGRVLVHGSVLERRPPGELTRVVEELLGELWRGEGLAGAGYVLAADMIWKRVLVALEAGLRGLTP